MFNKMADGFGVGVDRFVFVELEFIFKIGINFQMFYKSVESADIENVNGASFKEDVKSERVFSAIVKNFANFLVLNIVLYSLQHFVVKLDVGCFGFMDVEDDDFVF